jgi:DNA polymerase II small subunit
MDGKSSRNDCLEKKQAILSKLVNTGTNISPSTLEYVLKLDNPLVQIDDIIKKATSIPTFNSHLTPEILKKISEGELQKASNRNVTQVSSSFREKIEVKKENVNNSNAITNSDAQELDVKSELLEETHGELITHPKTDVVFQKKSAQKNNVSEPILNEIIKIKPHGTTKSAFRFKPIAKEYSFQLEILKDPTGKIHTSGKYDDFYEMTVNKFNKLYQLMKKRPEVHTAVKISNMLRNSRSQQVSTIGLVKAIRETKKGNYFITLEDLTGSVNAIVKKDSENIDNRKIVERTIEDQMIYIEGTYSPGENNSRGVIFADVISKIGIPNNFQPNKSPDPLSIALISDTHIGSKEFESDLWNKFIDFLNGRNINKKNREIAGRIKYLVINGDLVDGVGIYPSQQEDLTITDIFQQFTHASELLSEIPDHVKIIFSSGNHDPVRNAIPRPAVPKKYASDLIDIGVKCVGNPSLIQTHNVKTLVYHGDSMLDMNLLISGLENDKPVETMKEFLTCRHLAPVYGKRTQIAPVTVDWLVIDSIPDIFHTGHIHINGFERYKSVSLVNSGCFQAQTDFMKSFGIIPTPGVVPIIELDTLNCLELDLITT